MSRQPICSYSHTVGMYADTGRGFFNPVDVGLGRDGLMYVVNRAGDGYGGTPQKRVTICTVSDGFIGQFSGIGTGDGDIMWPVACVVDEDGLVYINDEALNRVSIFDKDGGFLRKWGVQGSGDGEFNGPSGMALDQDHNLVMVDGLNNRIQRYDRDGGYLGGWGEPGEGPGQFNLPWGAAVDSNGDVYVADWRNDRIQKFDAGGTHLASFGSHGDGDGEFNRPSDVAVDDDGYVYVTDWGNNRLQVLNSDGEFVMEAWGEATLNRWVDEYYVTNPDELELRCGSTLEPEVDPADGEVFAPKPAFVEKLFWGPSAVEIDDKGRIYIVESGRYRIQVYQKNAT